jgi:putative copper export protein
MTALEAIVAAISYSTTAALLGQLVAAGFLLPSSAPAEARRSLAEGAMVSLLVFLGAALLGLLVQGAKLQHGMPSAELLLRYLDMTQSGKVWLARAGYGGALALIMWGLRLRFARLRILRMLALLALPLVASRSLTSHAVAVRENTLAAVAADAIHLIVTALWAGGLLALWRLMYPVKGRMALTTSSKAQLINRFSPFALASVGLLVITGLYQSWIQVGSLSALASTAYGNALGLKLILFLAMLGLGAFNLFYTKPQLARAAAGGSDCTQANRRALRRIRAESLIGVLILCATGLVTVLPPGVHAVHRAVLSNQPGPPQPAEGARVEILSPTPGQTLTGDQVPLSFRLTRGKRGHHVHAYIDGQLMGMFESEHGTLNGVAPGKHLLELRVIAEDHQTELDATDRTEFVVK